MLIIKLFATCIIFAMIYVYEQFWGLIISYWPAIRQAGGMVISICPTRWDFLVDITLALSPYLSAPISLQYIFFLQPTTYSLPF